MHCCGSRRRFQYWCKHGVQCRRPHFNWKKLCKFKNYGAKRLIREFPTKGWSVSSVNKLLKKLRDTGTTARRAGSGRRRSERIDDNVDSVNELVLSQEVRRCTENSSIHSSNSKGNRRPSFVGVPHCLPGSQVKMPEETSRTGTNPGKLRITPDSSEETFASFPRFCCGFHILHRREDL